MTHTLTIASRELRSLFVSPVAYVVLTLWSVIAGTFFLASLIGFQERLIQLEDAPDALEIVGGEQHHHAFGAVEDGAERDDALRLELRREVLLQNLAQLRLRPLGRGRDDPLLGQLLGNIAPREY